MIVAMVVGSLAAGLVNLQFGPEATGIRTVGQLDVGLPPLSLPDFSIGAIKSTVFSALVVTVLALTEAVSIARSIAVKSEQHIDANQEFMGRDCRTSSAASFRLRLVRLLQPQRRQLRVGRADPARGCVLGALPARHRGADRPARRLAADSGDGRDPLPGCLGLIDFHAIREIWAFSRAETAVFMVTFVGTLVELERGIFLGIITSLVFYLLRTSRPAVREFVPDPQAEPTSKRKFVLRHPGLPDCPQLSCLRVEGSIFFGAVDHVQKHVTAVDAAIPGRSGSCCSPEA